jgi:PKHD-type hydroxylase
MIREDARRALLFDMDMALVRLNQQLPNDPSLVSLTGCYHNLIRMWGDA